MLNCKVTCWALLLFFCCNLSFAENSGEAERLALIKEFKELDKADTAEMDKAFYNIDLIRAAGRQMLTSDSKVLRAVDYKLRQLKSARDRQILLLRFIEISIEAYKIANASTENTGRLENLFRYSRIADMQSRFAEILLLPIEQEKLWLKICNSSGMIGKNKIDMKNGVADFTAKRYDRECQLQILLRPDHCRDFNGRYMAFVVSDMPGAVNYDFRENYVCEFKDGKIVKSVQLDTLINFRDLEYKNGKVIISGIKCKADDNKNYRKELDF